MANFDILECGFSAADETINFGTRCLADGDSLYEAATLSTLRCSEEGPTSIFTSAKIKNGRIFFSLHNNFRGFNDIHCSAISTDIQFDSFIDTYTFTPNGDYMLVCLRNAAVYIVDCAHNFNSLQSRILVEEQSGDSSNQTPFFVGSYFESLHVSTLSFLTIDRSGELHRITYSIDEDRLVTEMIHNFKFGVHLAAFMPPFLLVNGTFLAVFDVETNDITVDKALDLKRVFPLDHMFLALDSTQKLVRICAHTLQVFSGSSELYSDAILCDFNETSRRLISVANDSIKVENFFDFSLVYTLSVKHEVVLIEPESIDDELIFIALVREGEAISEMRFMGVSEAQPELRLHRLLKRRKYDEAESFSRLFGLDPSMIIKAKVGVIIDNIAEFDVGELILLLDQIDDVEFKLRTCLDSDSLCKSTKDVKKILLYGCKMEIQEADTNQIGLLNEKKTLLAEGLFRLNTFMMLHAGKATDTVDNYNCFAECDLIKEMKCFLKKYEFERAAIIFGRLDKKTEQKFSLSNVEAILRIIDTCSSKAYMPFLSNFIPQSLQLLPDAILVYLNWTYTKILSFETKSKYDFPNNAIEFTKKIVNFIKTKTVLQNSIRIISQEYIDKLSSLLQALDTVNELKSNFQIAIAFTDILDGSHTVIRTLLNQRLSPKEYEYFIENFLLKFIHANGLDMDKILHAEIMEILNYAEKYWTEVIGVLLNSIGSTDLRIEIVKRILHVADVPWSQAIKNIANQALKYSHSMTKEIELLIIDEPVQVVFKKYKIQLNRIDDEGDMRFVIGRILYENDANKVDDIYQLVKKQEKNLHQHAIGLLVKHFITKGDYVQALEILGNEAMEDKVILCDKLVTLIETYMNDPVLKSCNKIIRENYIKVAPLLIRLIESTTDIIAKKRMTEKLEIVQKVYQAENMLNITIRTGELNQEFAKRNLINNFLLELSEGYKSENLTLDNLTLKLKMFTVSLSIDYGDCFIQLAAKSDDFGLIFAAAEYAYDIDNSVKNLCLIIVLILKNLGLNQHETNLANETCFLEKTTILDNNDDMFYLGLKLTDKIILKIAELSDSDESNSLIPWINSLFFAINFARNAYNAFPTQFYPGIKPGMATFTAIRIIFTLFCRFAINFKLPHMAYLTLFEPIAEQDLIAQIAFISVLIDDVCQERQQFTAYNLLRTLISQLHRIPDINQEIIKQLHALVGKYIPKLFELLFTEDEIDQDALYSLLVGCDINFAKDLVIAKWRFYKRKPSKVSPLLEAGIRLRLGNAYKVKLMEGLLTVKWWRKYEHEKCLNYDIFFKATPEARFDILIDAGLLEFDDISLYCHDYRLELAKAYVTYFKRIFEKYRPRLTKNDGKRTILVENNEEVLMKKCEPFLVGAIDRDNILLLVELLWNSTNYYYYEVFIVFIEILRKLKANHNLYINQFMLNFLKNYERVSKPSEDEIKQWYQLYPDSHLIDKLSEVRLPFTPILFKQDLLRIIRPEINLKTYKLWCQVSSIVPDNICIDDICSYAVKEVVTSGVLARHGVEWCLNSKFADLLKEIDECVQNISNLKVATSVSYHILSNMPPGVDKVSAAEMCYKYAKLYKAQDPNASSESFLKVEKKYRYLSACQILHAAQLTDEKYESLIQDPQSLILNLYQDPRILNKIELNDAFCPDINKAVDELAKVFDLDATENRRILVLYLIGYRSTNDDLESIITISSDSLENCLKRASYICLNVDLGYWQLYLYGFGMDDEFVIQRSYLQRANALKLFSMITDAKKIETITEMTMEFFNGCINKLNILNNLQILQIDMNIQALTDCDVKQLLKKLSQIKNSMAIKTMALICMSYNIMEPKYWEFIVRSAIKLSMFTDLKTYIFVLQDIKYFYEPFFINAWQSLINHSYKNLYGKEDDELKTNLIYNYILVQSCPIIDFVDLELALANCMEYGKPQFAALFLPYIEKEKQAEFLTQIKNCEIDVTKELLEMKEYGFYGLQIVIELLNC